MKTWIKRLLILALFLSPLYFLTTAGLNQLQGWVQGGGEAPWAIETTYDIGKLFLFTGRYEEAAQTFHGFLLRYRKSVPSSFPWETQTETAPNPDTPEKAKTLLPYAQFYYAQSLQNQDETWTDMEALREYKDFLERYPDHELHPKAEDAIFYLQHIRKIQDVQDN